jgi:hypothetical protein
LPALIPDYRDSAEALAHRDLRLSFDGNRYCVPPRYVGCKLTVKADSSSLTIYDQHQQVAKYARSFERGQTFGAERFQKELFAQMAAAERSAAQQHRGALFPCRRWSPAGAGTLSQPALGRGREEDESAGIGVAEYTAAPGGGEIAWNVERKEMWISPAWSATLPQIQLMRRLKAVMEV